MNVGPVDMTCVGADDDSSVHLCELRHPLSGEGRVAQRETAAAHSFDLGRRPKQHERPGSLAKDQVNGVPQRGTGSESAEYVERGVDRRSHHRLRLLDKVRHGSPHCGPETGCGEGVDQ